MKILILGNGNSIYIKSYIEKILLSNGYNEIALITPQIANVVYNDFYKENSIKIITYYNNLPGFIKKSNLLRRTYAYLKVIFEGKDFNPDYIHVHFINIEQCLVSLGISKKKTKIIGSFWGSDILLRKPLYLKFERIFFCRVNALTISTEKMLEEFILKAMSNYKKNIYNPKFGNEILDVIKEISKNETISTCKEYYKFPEKKVTISIGYNGAEEQNHLKIIQEIKNIPILVKEGIHIILQGTYGGKSDYIKALRYELDKTGCTYTIINKYLSDIDIAKLRIATDIFIHGQVSDAMSGSIQECLYVNTCLINGAWLHYKEFDNLNIKYEEFEKFEELSGIIVKKINQLILTPRNVSSLNETIYKYSSWDAVAEHWLKIYEK